MTLHMNVYFHKLLTVATEIQKQMNKQIPSCVKVHTEYYVLNWHTQG